MKTYKRLVRRPPMVRQPEHRANLLTEDTDPFCRLPLATLSRKPKAFRLGDRLRYKVRSESPQRPLASWLFMAFLKDDPNCDNQQSRFALSVFLKGCTQAAQGYCESRLSAKKRRELSKSSCRSSGHQEHLVRRRGLAL